MKRKFKSVGPGAEVLDGRAPLHNVFRIEPVQMLARLCLDLYFVNRTQSDNFVAMPWALCPLRKNRGQLHSGLPVDTRECHTAYGSSNGSLPKRISQGHQLLNMCGKRLDLLHPWVAHLHSSAGSKSWDKGYAGGSRPDAL